MMMNCAVFSFIGSHRTCFIEYWQVVEHWIAVSYKTSQVHGCLMESCLFIVTMFSTFIDNS